MWKRCARIDAVVEVGLTPTHLDWHCLADGGRADIQRDEPLRRARAVRPLDHEVVVGAHELALEALVVERLEVVLRDSEVAEERRGRDAVAIHDLEPFLRVPGRRVDLAPARQRREVAPPSCRVLLAVGLDHGRCTEHTDALVADEPQIGIGLLVVAHGRDQVTPLRRRHPAGPEVGRLAQVGVGIDDGCAHRSLVSPASRNPKVKS